MTKWCSLSERRTNNQPLSFTTLCNQIADILYKKENDQLFPDDIREAGQRFLEENKIDHKFEIYSGVPHGMYTYLSLFSTAVACNMR